MSETDPLAELREAVQPVIDELESMGFVPRDTSGESVASAAMRVVAQARVDATMRVPCQYRYATLSTGVRPTCWHEPERQPIDGGWCRRCTVLADTLALLALLDGEEVRE